MPVKKARASILNRKSSTTKLSRSADRTAARAARRPPVVEFFRERRLIRGLVARDRVRRYKTFLQQVNRPNDPPTGSSGIRVAHPRPGKENLRILAEGDSWFEYPLPWPRGDGVIYQLQGLLGYTIANMAHHGLEVDQIMGLSLRQEIVSRLTAPEVKYDALLFSGGGDDLVGDRFCIWLRDTPPPVPPPQMLDDNAVNAALAVLEGEYHELVDLRDQYSPGTVIFVHDYDFPAITGKGVCGDGPWLKPSLDYAYKHIGVASPAAQDEYEVVKILLQKFGAMLNTVATDPKVKDFVLVQTQGTLKPTNSDWQNEIHPSPSGFKKLARKFQEAITARFQ
jgi:hypothetical protein